MDGEKAMTDEELRIISESLKEYLEARREYNRVYRYLEVVKVMRK